MNIKQQLLEAIKRFVDHMPQPNMESDAAQQMLVESIYQSIFSQTEGTYNHNQLNFFTEFDGQEHK